MTEEIKIGGFTRFDVYSSDFAVMIVSQSGNVILNFPSREQAIAATKQTNDVSHMGVRAVPLFDLSKK